MDNTAINNYLSDWMRRTPWFIPLNDHTKGFSLLDPSECGIGCGRIMEGWIRVPHKNGQTKIPLRTSFNVDFSDAGIPFISNVSFDFPLKIWELNSELVLTDARVRLLSYDSDVQVRLSGFVQFTDDELNIAGSCDTSVTYDPTDPEDVSFETRLINARLIIRDKIHYDNGEIGLEFLSKQQTKSSVFFQGTYENTVPHYTSAGCIPLGSMKITGIFEQPISMMVHVRAIAGVTESYLKISPASLRTKTFGAETVLFVHGEHYDDPFIIAMHEPWTAGISSNVRMHLLHPCNPEGSPLVLGTAALCGILKGEGLTAHTLELKAELTGAAAFPESKWPQEMPDQEIACTISGNGDAVLEVVLNPILIDGFSIHGSSGIDQPVTASLSNRGLRFQPGNRASRRERSAASVILDSFTLNEKCQIVDESHTAPIDVCDWCSSRFSG